MPRVFNFWSTTLIVLTICLGDMVIGSQPKAVVRWDFDDDALASLQTHGDVKTDQSGPRPPRFEDLDPKNKAIRLTGNGYLSLEDPGANSEYDFGNGDEITLEAWVKVDQARRGQNMYLIGKGRTHGPKATSRDNQNWALRVVYDGSKAQLSFLFATERSKQQTDNHKNDHWHRWTSSDGFALRSGWHHVAVAYRFGEPDTIRGWIDGSLTIGTWDMGGSTTRSPIVDDDEIWIGSSLGGNAGNSFRGLMDGVAVHRNILDDTVIASRYQPTMPPPTPIQSMPDVGSIESNSVSVWLMEDVASDSDWIDTALRTSDAAMQYALPHFLFPRIPLRYDSRGMRKAWESPVLARMASDVALPSGKHRFL
ncbi:MAG: LamG-like jellyroll fold domain-containing protein, partial [Planctomycetota bacterium]